MLALGWTLYALGTIGDAWTTREGLRSGRMREANPVLRFLFDRIPGDWDIWLIKAAYTGLLVWVRPPWGLLVALGAVQLVVAWRNWRLLRKLGVK